MASRPIAQICEQCGKSFETTIGPANIAKGYGRFCSRKCQSAASKLTDVTCPICGQPFKPNVADVFGNRKKFCSRACADKGLRIWDDEVYEFVEKVYPEQGPEPAMKKYGLTRKQVYSIAGRAGTLLTKEEYRKRVHGGAQKYMSENNPMKREEVVEKVRKWSKSPKGRKQYYKLLEGQARIQKNNPSKLELRATKVLDQAGIKYEHQCVIKPKFIVDIKLGNLIIQLDGDYWHGHPRFEPLAERQRKQQARDRSQDKYLTACGYTVVRIWESDYSSERLLHVIQDNICAVHQSHE